MEIKIFCPLWGHEHLDIVEFTGQIKAAGYDGLDTWMPEDASESKKLLDALAHHELLLVTQQHQAHGDGFDAFKASFLQYLHGSMEGGPLLINSHTGRDYFSFEQNLELIDIAAEFSEKTGIRVLHETHRGRFGYGPAAIQPYFDARPALRVTADFSHWTCVTESFLENFSDTLDEAIRRTSHIHARVGYDEGPQVSDPRAPEWKDAVDRFMGWWLRIADARLQENVPLLTVTTEFGPPPYLPVIPFTRHPVADQFEINCYMKDLVRDYLVR